MLFKDAKTNGTCEKRKENTITVEEGKAANANASSGVIGYKCSLQKTVVISFCTLELTPPIRYSPSVLIPARQSRSSAFKQSRSRSLDFRLKATRRLTSRLHQADTLPHKVESGLIKIRCGTRREQRRTKARINCQLTDAAD